MWKFWIDRGGTFTDCLGLGPDGAIRVVKVLSDDRAPVAAIRRILGLDDHSPIPPSEIRMGTTVATNALLERKGADTALVITRGFGDLLAIGTQARPEIFALDVIKPEPLCRTVLEVDARLDASGQVIARPDEAELLDALRALRTEAESVAVAVMHAYHDDSLERAIADLARQAGFSHVVTSRELAAEPGLLARADTAVVDAYLTPRLRAYVESLTAELGESRLWLMPSSGDLVEAARFRGPAAVLSGPAGGVVACGRIAEAAAIDEVIGIDMGGTSTDVCRVEGGQPSFVYETETAGVRIRAPMVDVHTVAAGGGSICRFDGQRLRVGPDSAGADPGPICYGRGGRDLTLTDVNLALGRVQPDRFPFALDRAGVAAALAEIAARAGYDDPLRLAGAFFEIANAHMAEAIKQISVARGYDVRQHALLLFGGAAGQHGCALAEQLGVRRIVAHPFAGVLSAYGMGLADRGVHGERDLGRVELSPEALAAAMVVLDELEAEGRATLGIADAVAVRKVDLRYRGTETTLSIEAGGDLRAAFEAAHHRRYGYARPGHPIELTTARVQVRGGAAPHHEPTIAAAKGPPPVLREERLWHDGPVTARIYAREALLAGHTIEGPAIVLEDTGTLVIDPGFVAVVDARGWIFVEARDLGPAPVATPHREPMWLELFHNQFASIAEQMGRVLRRTALSTNIRERLDFSCALFDDQGGLVANAPHIPVHLGAMEETVKAVLREHPRPAPGDAYVTNDPARGGSHLPDITVVTPVHVDGAPPFFVASRGHHADVGGMTPGSMPAGSQRLEDEGVVLRSLRVVRAGRFEEARLREALASGPHPARDPDQNVADIEAQIAANQLGAELLTATCARHGRETVAAYMRHVQDDAAERVARAIAAFPDGEHRFADALDDGTPVVVTITVADDRMRIDFSESGPQVDDNLNAPRAVTVSAVLYVLRLLVGEPIPLASGCLRPVGLSIPRRSVLWPDPDRAVAAGNVETSQRIVDVLLGALGLAAASQGTMNNLSFGSARWGYYETLAGGTGATRSRPGADAVQSHMTNTRITDPEILESRFPVRLHEFSIRRGSGGAGAHPGGEGVVRTIEALAPITATILSERRSRAPFGLAGGGPGKPGENAAVLAGKPTKLPAKATIALAPGDRIRIETPGGGGFGVP